MPGALTSLLRRRMSILLFPKDFRPTSRAPGHLRVRGVRLAVVEFLVAHVRRIPPLPRTKHSAEGKDGTVTVISKNNVTFAGNQDGTTVMLAHGFGCDQNLWRLVAGRLRDEFRVVLFDHVGSGNSDAAAW